LQVSYTYQDTKEQLLEIHQLINKHANIKEAKSYILVDTGFINHFILKDFSSYKPDLSEIKAKIKEGENVMSRLSSSTLVMNDLIQDDVHFKELFMSTRSMIFDDTKIIYSILLDESSFHNSLQNLNYLMLFITILGLLAIIVITKIRSKEVRLNEQDSFVQSAMHEIKTPLSIITLNNELRELTFGKDEFSSEIDSAVRTLRNSYEDMSFILTKDELHYSKEVIDLSQILHMRVDYFQSIAKANEKTIQLTTDGHCKIEISLIELTRLIDNNLSNAIKYSDIGSPINVTLNTNLLTFENQGNPIQNNKKVFDKYFRENHVIGGYGLGLNIVSDIAKKHFVEIGLSSTKQNGTIFSYTFKCHSNDI